MVDGILEFRGVNFIYSNFYLSNMYSRGLRFRHSEGVFQCYKTEKYSEVIEMCGAKPGETKSMGRKVDMVDNWQMVKVDVMFQTVLKKFLQSEFLKERLLSTNNLHIEEGNTHGDKIWGTVNGEGQNLLGICLMGVREYIREKISVGDFDTLDIIRDVDKITSNYNRIKYLLLSQNKACTIAEGDLMVIGFNISKFGYSFRYSFIDYAQPLMGFTTKTQLKVLNKVNYEYNLEELTMCEQHPETEILKFPELDLDTLEYSGSIIIDRLKVIDFIKEMLGLYGYDISSF